MLYTDYEWFEAYEDTIDRYFAEDEGWIDPDEPFIDEDEDEFGEMPMPWVED